MTKGELIAEIASRTGMEKTEVAAVVEAFMAAVKEELVEGKESVFLRGFGTFMLKYRAAKTGRNIAKNTTLDIPARYIPYFKPARELSDAVADLEVN